ncbi:MAG: cysteine--1-D-myo-inosityl 2-amino-2-deoxy-alpha-D-glucopyranoside ligase [Rhodoglobus sp.]
MRAWSRPFIPRLPGTGSAPRLFDTITASLVSTQSGPAVTLYVCGITPYDATHIGHAATYTAYDTLVRVWLDAGFHVGYAQNVTDIDDPLLERAEAAGVDWKDLARQQIELFRSDMLALAIIPPDHYIAVTETITLVAQSAQNLLGQGLAYFVDRDVYFDSTAAESSLWQLKRQSRLDRDSMVLLSAERGGDPERAGKRDPLDPVLWVGARSGEPSWPSSLGAGRPGWHIECSVIAAKFLTLPMTVAGGGRDLIFPHHAFTAGHSVALTGHQHARVHVHTGLVAYRGEKMSKSLGNLVFVSELLDEEVDSRAVRLAILAHHYRSDWEWTDEVLAAATQRLTAWVSWAKTFREHSVNTGDTLEMLGQLRAILSNDLNTPAALDAVDVRAATAVPPSALELDAIHALLGVDLRQTAPPLIS